jgi:hypothetical protein
LISFRFIGSSAVRAALNPSIATSSAMLIAGPRATAFAVKGNASTTGGSGSGSGSGGGLHLTPRQLQRVGTFVDRCYNLGY